MMLKLIGMGNRLMGDDGVGVTVAEMVMKDALKYGAETIIGETDGEYCIDKIDDGDCLIIIDSLFDTSNAGEMLTYPLGVILNNPVPVFSQHHQNLLHLLRIYRKNVDGILLCIKVTNIEFGSDLSPEIKNSIENICTQIVKMLESIASSCEAFQRPSA